MQVDEETTKIADNQPATQPAATAAAAEQHETTASLSNRDNPPKKKTKQRKQKSQSKSKKKKGPGAANSVNNSNSKRSNLPRGDADHQSPKPVCEAERQQMIQTLTNQMNQASENPNPDKAHVPLPVQPLPLQPVLPVNYSPSYPQQRAASPSMLGHNSQGGAQQPQHLYSAVKPMTSMSAEQMYLQSPMYIQPQQQMQLAQQHQYMYQQQQYLNTSPYSLPYSTPSHAYTHPYPSLGTQTVNCSPYYGYDVNHMHQAFVMGAYTNQMQNQNQNQNYQQTDRSIPSIDYQQNMNMQDHQNQQNQNQQNEQNQQDLQGQQHQQNQQNQMDQANQINQMHPVNQLQQVQPKVQTLNKSAKKKNTEDSAYKGKRVRPSGNAANSIIQTRHQRTRSKSEKHQNEQQNTEPDETKSKTPKGIDAEMGNTLPPVPQPATHDQTPIVISVSKAQLHQDQPVTQTESVGQPLSSAICSNPNKQVPQTAMPSPPAPQQIAQPNKQDPVPINTSQTQHQPQPTQSLEGNAIRLYQPQVPAPVPAMPFSQVPQQNPSVAVPNPSLGQIVKVKQEKINQFQSQTVRVQDRSRNIRKGQQVQQEQDQEDEVMIDTTCNQPQRSHSWTEKHFKYLDKVVTTRDRQTYLEMFSMADSKTSREISSGHSSYEENNLSVSSSVQSMPQEDVEIEDLQTENYHVQLTTEGAFTYNPDTPLFCLKSEELTSTRFNVYDNLATWEYRFAPLHEGTEVNSWYVDKNFSMSTELGEYIYRPNQFLQQFGNNCPHRDREVCVEENCTKQAISNYLKLRFLQKNIPTNEADYLLMLQLYCQMQDLRLFLCKPCESCMQYTNRNINGTGYKKCAYRNKSFLSGYKGNYQNRISKAPFYDDTYVTRSHPNLFNNLRTRYTQVTAKQKIEKVQSKFQKRYQSKMSSADLQSKRAKFQQISQDLVNINFPVKSVAIQRAMYPTRSCADYEDPQAYFQDIPYILNWMYGLNSYDECHQYGISHIKQLLAQKLLLQGSFLQGRLEQNSTKDIMMALFTPSFTCASYDIYSMLGDITLFLDTKDMQGTKECNKTVLTTLAIYDYQTLQQEQEVLQTYNYMQLALTNQPLISKYFTQQYPLRGLAAIQFELTHKRETFQFVYHCPFKLYSTCSNTSAEPEYHLTYGVKNHISQRPYMSLKPENRMDYLLASYCCKLQARPLSQYYARSKIYRDKDFIEYDQATWTEEFVKEKNFVHLLKSLAKSSKSVAVQHHSKYQIVRRSTALYILKRKPIEYSQFQREALVLDLVQTNDVRHLDFVGYTQEGFNQFIQKSQLPNNFKGLPPEVGVEPEWIIEPLVELRERAEMKTLSKFFSRLQEEAYNTQVQNITSTLFPTAGHIARTRSIIQAVEVPTYYTYLESRISMLLKMLDTTEGVEDSSFRVSVYKLLQQLLEDNGLEGLPNELQLGVDVRYSDKELAEKFVKENKWQHLISTQPDLYQRAQRQNQIQHPQQSILGSRMQLLNYLSVDNKQQQQQRLQELKNQRQIAKQRGSRTQQPQRPSSKPSRRHQPEMPVNIFPKVAPTLGNPFFQTQLRGDQQQDQQHQQNQQDQQDQHMQNQYQDSETFPNWRIQSEQQPPM